MILITPVTLLAMVMACVPGWTWSSGSQDQSSAEGAPMARRTFDVVDTCEILTHWHAGRSKCELAGSLGLLTVSAIEVAFSPDGRVLASADTNLNPQHGGTVQLWDVSLAVWDVSLATDAYRAFCAEVGPPSASEWKRYAPGEPQPKTCNLSRQAAAQAGERAVDRQQDPFRADAGGPERIRTGAP